VQVILRALGVYSGKTDGFFSTDLRDAIYQLEAEYERPQTGQMSFDTVRLIYNVVAERQEKEKQRVAQAKQQQQQSSEGMMRSSSSSSLVSDSVFSDIAESLEVLRLVMPESEPTYEPPSSPVGNNRSRARRGSRDGPFSPPTSPSSAAAAAAAATSPYRSVGARSSASPLVLDAALDPLEPIYRRLGTPASSAPDAEDVRFQYCTSLSF
jgi:hypothetical protein